MKTIIISFISLLAITGCNKFEDGLNVNPNLPSTSSNTQLIANAALYLPGLSTTPQGEYNAQFLSETEYPNLSLYNQVSFNFYDLYTGPLMNLETVLNAKSYNGNEGPVANQIAVAKILKAYFFWHITDRWGDVPYSEALKAEANFTPKYDKQSAIYDSLFKLLEDANGMIVTGNISNDIIYGGDMTKWKKLANTMRMLMALRLSKIDPAKGTTQFNAGMTAGPMTANTDNFVYKHLPDAANQNYWYGQVFGMNRSWWALSKTLVDRMKPTGDPRLAIYGEKTKALPQDYVGLPYGNTAVINKDNYSLLGTGIWKQDAHIHLVTYAQMLFAKAEAAKLGWIAGGDATAKTNYDLAIEQSVRQWNNNSITGLPAMMAHVDVVYNPATALQQIANQRYIHLFMHGYEAWAEYRRTGYPNDMVSPGGKAVPRRQGYPAPEVFNNTVNYQQAIQTQFSGQDNLTGRVWWDKP
jgi:hypothetical protein